MGFLAMHKVFYMFFSFFVLQQLDFSFSSVNALFGTDLNEPPFLGLYVFFLARFQHQGWLVR